MTPDKQRKANERQRKLDAGLVEIQVWVRKEDAQKVRDYAAKLRSSPSPPSGEIASAG